MGLEQDETHAGHEACRGNYSQLVVDWCLALTSGVVSHRDQAMSLQFRETLQVGATRHQVTQLSPTSAALALRRSRPRDKDWRARRGLMLGTKRVEAVIVSW